MSKSKRSKSNEFLTTSKNGGKERLSQSLANMSLGADQYLGEEQKSMLSGSGGSKLTMRNLRRFIQTVRKSPFFECDFEEECENRQFVSAHSEQDLFRMFSVYEDRFFKHFGRYYQKDDRRHKLRHVSRAAGSLLLLAEIKRQLDERKLSIKSLIFKVRP
ncbi:hypothetical protein WJR50_32885 [Catalinimonas sp. 4WD22]|uniref:hypothetical protein n=1 Tax=Catalinimonas locisalis TaxID=3133978 RepID=UPI0031019272